MKNLLYLTHRVPFPPNRGDRIRTYHVLRHLARRANVSLVCLADEPAERAHVEELERHAVRVAVVPVDPLRWVRAGASFLAGRTVTEGAFQAPRLERIVATWARTVRFDAALASSSGMAPYLQTPELCGVPSYVDLIDVDSQKWLDYAGAARRRPWLSWLYRAEGRRLRRLEAGLAGWVRGIAVVSEAEARVYRAFRPDGPVRAIPNGVDTDYFRPAAPSNEPVCVFVGALDYRPNAEGIQWFSREVWPQLRARRPEATLRIVGRNPGRSVRSLARVPGVEVVGAVPDVRPYLKSAAVVVAPLQIARGVQNKVLEALAMRRAVVSSPGPLAGLGVEPGTHLLSASSAAEWVTGVSRLLDDPGEREELALAGHAYVTAHHRWETCLAGLAGFLKLDASERNRGKPAVAGAGAAAT